MEIKVGDFVLIDSKYDPENTILTVTDIKNNQVFGNIVQSVYPIGASTYVHFKTFIKIVDPDEILRLQLIHKIYLLGKS